MNKIINKSILLFLIIINYCNFNNSNNNSLVFAKILFRDFTNLPNNNNNPYVNSNGICNIYFSFLIHEDNSSSIIKQVGSNVPCSPNDYQTVYCSGYISFSSTNITYEAIDVISSSTEYQQFKIDTICLEKPNNFELVALNSNYLYSYNDIFNYRFMALQFKNQSLPFFTPGFEVTNSDKIFVITFDKINKIFGIYFNMSDPTDYYKSQTVSYGFESINDGSITFLSNSNPIEIQSKITKDSLEFSPKSKQSYTSVLSTFNIAYKNSNNDMGFINYNLSTASDYLKLYPVYDTQYGRTFLTIYQRNLLPSTSLQLTFDSNRNDMTVISMDQFNLSITPPKNLNDGIDPTVLFYAKYEELENSIKFFTVDYQGMGDPPGLFQIYDSISLTVSVDLKYPFSYKNGNGTYFEYIVSAPMPLYFAGGISYYLLGKPQSFSDLFTTTIQDSLNYPNITDFYIYDIGGMKIIIEMIISSITPFTMFTDAYKNILCSSKDLVSGSSIQGKYQFIYDYGFTSNSSLYYIYNSGNSYNKYQVPFIDYLNNGDGKYQYFPQLPISNAKSMSDFQVFYFKYNNIDLSDQGCYNTLYFKFKQDNLKDYLVKFNLYVSKAFTNKKTFESKWDNNLQLYKIDFYIPPNLLRMDVRYSIIMGLSLSTYSNDILVSFFGKNASLTVKSNYGDMMPPMVTNLIQPNDQSISQDSSISWTFEISDKINGFDYGELIITGSLDHVPHYFNFTSLNKNPFIDQYSFKIQLSKYMKSQYFEIKYMKLVDKSGHFSQFNYGEINPQFINPLSGYSSNLNRVNITNLNPNSFEFVVFSNLTVQPSIIDVGSNLDSSRTVNITFSTKNYYPIRTDTLPVVYLGDIYLKYVNYSLSLENVLFSNSTSTTFSINCIVPYGFGALNPIFINVYGIQSENTFFQGYSTLDLRYQNFAFKIDTKFTPNLPILLSSSTISNNGGTLTVYGKNLNIQVNRKFNVIYNSTFSQNVQPILNYGLVSIIPILPTNNQFTVQYSDELNYTSSIVVTPYIDLWSNEQSPSSTSSPSPTPTPQIKCLGTPVCGGVLQGICIENEGCKCIYPYSGLSCQSISKDYNITINQTSPQSNIQVSNNDIKYFGDISIVEIREIDINNKVLQSFDFTNIQWLYSNQTLDEYTQINNYNSNFTSIDSSNNQTTTFITVSIQYFKKQTDIYFAGLQLTQNPNSFKYNIKLTKYGFKSSLSRLEVIIKSTLETTYQDVCSSTELVESANTVMRLQVNDITFYSNYINRAIVDNKIISISNKLLNSNEIKQLQQSQSQSQNSYNNTIDGINLAQSYIAIQIPKYTDNLLLDPDFSVLLEPSELDSCKNSKGLTKSQLAGIIVGSTVGFIVLLLSLFLLLSKLRFKNEKLLKLHLKLKGR